jgi:nicotinamidase-related amidase
LFLFFFYEIVQNGSLPVPDGRSIAPTVNALLSLPFPLKLATRDWHPSNHISFASNHPSSPPPFTSTTEITHPYDPSQKYTTTLWPDHCVASTPGAQLVPELDADRIQLVIDKGQNDAVEMYSAFYDPFKIEDTGLATLLRVNGVTHVYVVGLAADYCVKATAEHANEEGYETYIVEEGTRAVMPEKWPAVRQGILDTGVRMVSIDGEEVDKVRNL